MKPATVEQSVHDVLSNWGRVVKDRYQIKTCYSAEGRYRPERVKDDDEREATARDEPDIHAAWFAEHVINSLTFPKEARKLLAGQYVFQLTKSQICRFCAVPVREYESKIGWAAFIFKNRLDMMNRSRGRMLGNNSIPPSLVSMRPTRPHDL
jgi:hypothetical protein